MIYTYEQDSKSMNQKEIAKRLNISQATVSMALRRSPRISESVVDAVERLADKEGYRPNFAGQMLRNGKTNMIGILFPSVVNTFFAELFHELLGIFRKHGYIVYVSEANNEEETRDAVDLFSRLNIAGVVAFGWCRDSLIRDRRPLFPLVFFDGDNEESAILLDDGSMLVSSVRTESRNAIAALVEKLAGDGRRRPAFLGPSKILPRFMSYTNAWEQSGVKVEFVCTPGELQAGYETARKLFSGKKWFPDCVFCHNDEVAHGVCRAIHDMGMRIPEDVAVAGFDNTAVGNYMIPSLSSIDLPRTVIANELASELLAAISGSAPPRLVTVPCRYIQRETT